MNAENPSTEDKLCAICGHSGSKSVIRLKSGRYLCRKRKACGDRLRQKQMQERSSRGEDPRTTSFRRPGFRIPKSQW